MDFIENGTSGHPALALIATRTRKTGAAHKRHTVKAGEIRAIRLVPAEAGGNKSARRELLAIVNQPGSNWQKNWRIAEGAAVSTPEEIAQSEAQAVARAERDAVVATLPWYNVEHSTPRRSGYSGFDDAQAICDHINRRVGERIGCSGEEGREALQAEIDTLDAETVEIYGIRISEYQP